LWIACGFADSAEQRYVGVLKQKCCGTGFEVSLKHESTDDELLCFDVSSLCGFCDKYVVKDGSGSAAAELREPTLCQKLVQMVCPCGGNKLLMAVHDAAGDALFDLRTPSLCCKCGCLACSCTCNGPIKVALNVT
jgi:hypothetical protein